MTDERRQRIEQITTNAEILSSDGFGSELDYPAELAKDIGDDFLWLLSELAAADTIIERLQGAIEDIEQAAAGDDT